MISEPQPDPSSSPVAGARDAGPRPRVSFGLPVRNGEAFLERALLSLLAQDMTSIEVVVCDNASTDGTQRIATALARRDPRVRYVRNDEDVGQILNFNRVFELARGEFFRWIGADDQLEPTYASRCVATLEAHPEAVGATTLWRLIDDDGHVSFRRYDGARVDSPRAFDRLRTTLELFWGDRLAFDPIYSMIRGDVLASTELLPIDPWCDRMLAMELCLRGPWAHVDECLATRRDAKEPEQVRVPRFHPSYRDRRMASVRSMYAGLLGVVRRQPFAGLERVRAVALVVVDWIVVECRLRTRPALQFVARRLRRR